ncbi:head-tail connector protein [Sphingomonas jeddahensis]|uniref:Phage gp6-like head-tail connector protein n=1 Tax=Sphingomonas jeddahensis TaxID=1915074 RepID=A0A1V2EQZ2_9SPHN|nr:hypothetical protein [Sphingomonas jeddahensis]ONF94895.1 hypothetical protein SPHI_29420 [Sphingomonas jeddahensis]
MVVSGVPPAVIAAVVGEVRAFLRMESGEDTLLARVALSAVLVAEAFTGTLLIARVVEEVVASNGGWQVLEAGPVSAIDADGHAVDIDAEGRGWVRASERVTVRYTAGMAADWAGVPAPVAQGVVALAAHLFNDRGGASQPPAAVAALWRPYRRMRLMAKMRQGSGA